MAGQTTRLFDGAVFERNVSKSIVEDEEDSQDEKDKKGEKKETKEVIVQSIWALNIFRETVLHTVYFMPFHLSPIIGRQGPPPDTLV